MTFGTASMNYGGFLRLLKIKTDSYISRQIIVRWHPFFFYSGFISGAVFDGPVETSLSALGRCLTARLLIFSFLSWQAKGSLCESLTASLVLDVLSVRGQHNKRMRKTFFSLFFSDFNGSWHPKCRTAATFSLHLKRHPVQNSYLFLFFLSVFCL